MADQLTTLTTEQGPSLAAIDTPAPQAENLAPMVLASNEPLNVAVNSAPLAPVEVHTSTTTTTTTTTATPESYTVVVKAPPAGGMLAYLVGPGAQIELQGIDLNNATVAQEGGNLRITLPNGAEVLLLDYVNSAHDSHTMVITSDGKLPAQQLLAALDNAEVAQKAADVEPAAGPAGGGEGGGLLPPTILGLGVGEGEGIFSSVIAPYAIPRPVDAIFTNEYPFEPGLPPLQPGAPVNLPPEAHNDSFSTSVNKPITVQPGQLLANDSDPEGDTLTIVSVQGPTHGTVALNPDGTVTFTPEAGFQGTGSYSYTITDGHGGTSTADVIIQIDPDPVTQNNVIAADDAGTVVEGKSITINVLANDSDPEGDALVPGSVRIIAGPSNGPVPNDVSAHTNADGTITFTTVDNHSAAPYFITLEYEVSDARGARDTATVTVEVIPSANSVIAVDDTGEIFPAGQTKVFNVTGNDYDPQGDSFQITRIVTGPTVGRAVIDSAHGTITYESVASNVGYTQTIVYEITDARGAKDTATLTINVQPTNSVNAVDDTADMRAGQDVNIKVLNNDSDPQGDTFHITRIVDGPHIQSGTGADDGAARGSVAINADGTITYTDTPGARNSGVVEFTYEIVDSKGATDTAVVRVTIGTAANGVDANNDTLTLAQDAPRTNVTTTLLANDFDPQGDAFHITAVTQPTTGQGTVQLVGDQVFFTPAAGYHGPVIFSYTITDALGATDTAQVTVNVQAPVSTGLNAGDDAFSTPFNTNLTITPGQLLANDYDPDGTTLNGSNIISHTNPLNGTVTLDASGNFIYNPNDTFRGTDSFTYTIKDAQGDVATATVTIRVADPLSQDNPVDAVDDSATLQPTETKIINVLTNDSAPDGGLEFVRVVGALPAGVTNLGNGIFSYTAPAGNGDTHVSFQYEVKDIDGDTDIATVTFNVGPNSVDARDDVVTMATNVNSILIDAKANDVDPQGDTFHITRIISVSSGTATIENDQVRYVNDTRDAGTATIVYEITDSKGAKDTATITVNIVADFNNVIANDDVVTMAKDVNSILIDAKANDVDPQGDAFSITRIVSVSSGTATIENGQIRYNNPTRDAGDATIVYEVTDAKGATDTATITVHIVADTNNVIANDDDVQMAKDVNSILIDAKANDVDPQGDAFSITRIVSVSSGTATIENGQVRYTNPSRDAGTATIVYEVTDAKGATDTATITVHIAADTNNVIANDDVVTMAKDVNSILIDAKANDTDPQGDAFSITRIISVDVGTATIENGQVRYNNPTRDAGVAHIVYEITDSKGATDTATITVNIVADTNNVIANDDDVTMAKDVNSILIDAKANDVDPQGDAFSITRIVSVSSGTATIENGQVRYVNDTRDAGTATIVYEVTDAKGATDTATITVHIAADTNNVIANDDVATMAKDVNSILIDAKANDVDPQGDAFSITRIVSVDSGTATIENGQIRYNNATTAAGVAHIVYEVTDSKGATDTATITVNIAADTVNSVVAVDDTATMASNVNSILVDAKANDFDPQGDAFSITRIVSVDSGTATIENGQIRYNNATRDSGVAHIVYEITDVKGATSQATVTVNIAADTNNVVAVNDAATTTAGQSVAINVVANDYDPQGDAFTPVATTQPAIGSVSYNGNGVYTYNSVGRDAYDTSFTYTIQDTKGAQSTATVNIHVNAAANNVVAQNDSYNAGQPGNTIGFNVLGNDYDPQGDAFSIVAINGAPAGLSYQGNGNFAFTGQGRDAYDTSFTYVIQDTRGAQSTATVYLHVDAAPNNVVAQNDSLTVANRSSGSVNAIANDYDPQGDAFHIIGIVSGPGTGSAYVSGGNIVYTAGSGLAAYNTSLVYRIQDSRGAISDATVSIHVNAGSGGVYGGGSQGGGGGSGGGGGNCPLTIDLNNDGISIVMQSGSTAHFDLNGDGAAEWTSWVNGADDAILAIDRNNNGIIDGINEVFGGQDVDGFTELARMEDTNHDGVVDANDANFSSLRLWLDANHDGITDSSELHTLAEFGITSISVKSTDASIQYGDAYIDKESTVTFADGHTTSSGSVFYTNASNGHLTGTEHNDVLIYSAAADTIDGGAGMDTLKVLAASDIVINHDTMHSIEGIDMANNATDKLTLNVNDVLKLSDTGILTVTGDAVDQVTITGGATQGANVTQDGHTYASYSAGNGGTVLVDIGMTVHTQEQQH